MTFKEQQALDIDSVFLNDDEFAEEVVLDGIPLTLQMEDVSLVEIGIDAPGAYGHAKILYITSSDLPSGYGPEQEISLNGSTWTIKDLQDEAGMKVVELYRYTS